MNVLVDTSIWSLALRRNPIHLSTAELRFSKEMVDLIHEGRVILIGVVRQEILSGIREASTFRRLRDYLRAFPDEPLLSGDFEAAAALYGRCRSRRITGTHADLLLCAVAARLKCAIFTADEDFQRHAQCIAIQLHRPRAPRGGTES